MQTLAETQTPTPVRAKATRIQGINQCHKLAIETMRKLNPSDSPKSQVTLSDLDDPTFIHLPSGGQAIIYTLQILNLRHTEKQKPGAIANLLQKMYEAGWSDDAPGMVNVFSADTEGFDFGNANGGTFCLQFIW